MEVDVELKPCPFCGGEAKVYTTESRQSYRRAVAKCQTCFAELRCEGGGFHDFPEVDDEFEKRRLSNERAKERVIKAWNRRATERTCRFNVVFYKDFATPRQPGNICKCDACGYQHLYGLIVDARFRYCPNCGARIEVVE